MRKIVLLAIIVVAIAAIVLPFGRSSLFGHRLELKAYFPDAQGLRAGAPVRLAGVEVGSVMSVRARPDIRDNPAEVVMVLRTPYDLKVPSDSAASIATAGVLGETFAEIEVQGASGPPAQNGGVLRTRQTEVLSTKQFFERLENVLRSKPCSDQDDVAVGVTPKGNNGESGQKKSPR